MGVILADMVHRETNRARIWSSTVFALTSGAVVATVAVGSGEDPAAVLWPLVFTPLVTTALPVSFPRPVTRVTAAVVLAAFCVIAAASVGLFFVPATLVASWVAVRFGGWRT